MPPLEVKACRCPDGTDRDGGMDYPWLPADDSGPALRQAGKILDETSKALRNLAPDTGTPAGRVLDELAAQVGDIHGIFARGGMWPF